MPKKKPPVFKVRAVFHVWKPEDPTPRPFVEIVEECIGLVNSNREALIAIARSSVMGKLGHFGADTPRLDCDLWSYDFFASQSRDYGGTVWEKEPAWVPAVDPYFVLGEAERIEAIKSLIYLPADRAEQLAIYGA